jgi:hypothetical protein
MTVPHHDAAGPATIELATGCVTELKMTLPKIPQLALERQYGDSSRRIVHELGTYRVEQAAGGDRLIVTLGTPDGFEVSFASSDDSLAER